MPKQTNPSAVGTSSPGTTRIWNGQAFEQDLWQRLPDDEAPPAEGFALVTLERWRRQKSELDGTTNVTFGICLAPNDEIDPQSDEIHRLALIALAFPKFTDGRSYSTARRLRELWGYRNDLRATGDVLLDQIALMSRCGFTSFEIVDPATIRALERAEPTRMHRMYQSPTLHGDLRRSATSPRVLVAAE